MGSSTTSTLSSARYLLWNLIQPPDKHMRSLLLTACSSNVTLSLLDFEQRPSYFSCWLLAKGGGRVVIVRALVDFVAPNIGNECKSWCLVVFLCHHNPVLQDSCPTPFTAGAGCSVLFAGGEHLGFGRLYFRRMWCSDSSWFWRKTKNFSETGWRILAVQMPSNRVTAIRVWKNGLTPSYKLDIDPRYKSNVLLFAFCSALNLTPKWLQNALSCQTAGCFTRNLSLSFEQNKKKMKKASFHSGCPASYFFLLFHKIPTFSYFLALEGKISSYFL